MNKIEALLRDFNIFDLLMDILLLFLIFLINFLLILIGIVSKMDEKNHDLNKFYRILLYSFNRNLISSMDFEKYKHCQSNWDGLQSESSTIRFVDPNCLSLALSDRYLGFYINFCVFMFFAKNDNLLLHLPFMGSSS